MITLRNLLFGVAAASLLSSAGVNAADRPARVELPPPPVLDATPVASWTGFYVGGTGGAMTTKHSWTTNSVQFPGTMAPGLFNGATARADFGRTSFRAAGHIGYNFQVSPTTVAGIEADIGGPAYDSSRFQGIPGTFGGATALAQAGNADVTRALLRWDASIRGRVGFLATPTTMIYATGGVAFMATKYGISCPGVYPAGSWCVASRFESQSSTRTGWTLGAGVEGMIPNTAWIARAEYRYSDYGSWSRQFFAGAPVDGIDARQSLHTHAFLIGLSYKISDQPTALIAKY
jgi:outer membrane immunogenic protein